jgi:hypothetical protein
MEQWLPGLQPRLDDGWESSVPVNGSEDSIPNRARYAAAALTDPDSPALWPHVAGLKGGDSEARSTEKASGQLGDGRDVGSLIANLRALIQMCDGMR